MKILKYILFVILGCIALVLIVALFIPKEFHAENKITINRPNTDIYEYVSSLKNQGTYDPWSENDPTIVREYEGEDGTVGFIYEWESEKIGNGKQVITKLVPDKRVELDIYFDGSDVANKSFFDVIPINERQSEVSWGISGVIPYPFNIMTHFFDMDADFRHGLENLKLILEKK